MGWGLVSCALSILLSLMLNRMGSQKQAEDGIVQKSEYRRKIAFLIVFWAWFLGTHRTLDKAVRDKPLVPEMGSSRRQQGVSFPDCLVQSAHCLLRRRSQCSHPQMIVA